MSPSTPSVFRAAALASLAFCATSIASAQSIPYTNDFSGTGGNVAFTNENLDAAWTLNSGVYTNSYTPSAITVSNAVNRFTGVAGSSFTNSVQFTVTSVGNYGTTNVTFDVGLAAFGNDTVGTNGVNIGTGANLLYADFVASSGTSSSGTGVSGSLRLRTFVGNTATVIGSNTADANSGNANLAVTLNTTYTLKLTAINTGTNTYSLSLGLFDATGTTSIGNTAITATDFTAATEPGLGYFFGVRTRSGMTSTTASTVDFDNYSISAIPEPSSFAALAGLGVLGLAVSRRRLA